MQREIGRGRALANALAVLAILALAGFGVFRVAGRHWLWQETFRARAQPRLLEVMQELKRFSK